MSVASFRQFADCLREPALLVSATGELLSLNTAATALLGLSADAGQLHLRLADFLHGGGVAMDDFVRACTRSSQSIFASLSLRTPSGDIQPYRVEGLLYPAGPPDERPTVFLRLIATDAAAASMTSLDEQLRAIAPGRGGPARLMSVADLASRAAALIRPLASDVEFLVRNQGDSPAVLLNPGAIDRVLVQLGVHAAHNTAGGPVTIETSRELRDGLTWAAISITFPGPTLDAAASEQLFQPPLDSDAGSGISLASCRAAVLEMGGRLEAGSRPGPAQTLAVLLPGAAAPPDAVRAPENVLRVLVVDDDDLARQVMADSLASAGFQVLSAPGAAAAIELAAGQDRIDLLVTDVIMPRVTGPRLARTLRVTHPELRVLYVSGFTDRTDLLTDRLSAFLAKPFTRGTLLGRVRGLIEA